VTEKGESSFYFIEIPIPSTFHHPPTPTQTISVALMAICNQCRDIQPGASGEFGNFLRFF
jgi:hypothetical protein